MSKVNKKTSELLCVKTEASIQKFPLDKPKKSVIFVALFRKICQSRVLNILTILKEVSDF
jgi:hypothetical protein